MSLTEELQAMAGTTDLAEALVVLGLSDGSPAEVQPVADWYQGGAESFILEFLVITNASRGHYLLKAYIGSAGHITAGFENLLSRRRILSDRGLDTPRLYGAARATVLEEYIEFPLDQALKTAADDSLCLSNLIESIFFTAIAMDAMGFHILSPFADMRSRGCDTVVVDFGSDLGQPGVNSGRADCLAEARAFVSRVRRGVPEHILDESEENAAIHWQAIQRTGV